MLRTGSDYARMMITGNDSRKNITVELLIEAMSSSKAVCVSSPGWFHPRLDRIAIDYATWCPSEVCRRRSLYREMAAYFASNNLCLFDPRRVDRARN